MGDFYNNEKGRLCSVDKNLASSPEMAMQEFLACSHTCGWGVDWNISQSHQRVQQSNTKKSAKLILPIPNHYCASNSAVTKHNLQETVVATLNHGETLTWSSAR